MIKIKTAKKALELGLFILTAHKRHYVN